MLNCFTGTIYMTSDLNMIQSNINTCKVLMVTNEPLFEGHQNRVSATILLPPTQAIIADADDDIQTFQSLYYQYLISDEVTEFISLIFFVLHTGINIMIYIPKEDVKSLDYVSFLLGFMMNNYGIQIGTESIPFSFNPNYITVISDMLYLNNLIDYADMITSFPVQSMSDMSISKLYMDINPYSRFDNINDMRNYFLNYQNRIVSNNRYIPSVVSRYKEKE